MVCLPGPDEDAASSRLPTTTATRGADARQAGASVAACRAAAWAPPCCRSAGSRSQTASRVDTPRTADPVLASASRRHAEEHPASTATPVCGARVRQASRPPTLHELPSRDRTDRPAIQRLAEHARTGRRWSGDVCMRSRPRLLRPPSARRRGPRLPDLHGEVQTMEVVSQQMSMRMGNCLAATVIRRPHCRSGARSRARPTTAARVTDRKAQVSEYRDGRRWAPSC